VVGVRILDCDGLASITTLRLLSAARQELLEQIQELDDDFNMPTKQ